MTWIAGACRTLKQTPRHLPQCQGHASPLAGAAVPQPPCGPRRSVVTVHQAAERRQQPFIFHIPVPNWNAPLQRTRAIIEETLRKVPRARPGQTQQVEPNEVFPMGDLPHPEGRVHVHAYLVDAQESHRFIQEQGLLFDQTAGLKHFSDETVLDVPQAVTDAVNPRLPVKHYLSEQEIAEFTAHGMDVNEAGVKVEGYDYLMRMQPRHRTRTGETTGWCAQVPHFHDGPEPFHAQRLGHGFVPPDITAVIFHTNGAEVAPGGSFLAMKIDRQAAHQFCTIDAALLKKLAKVDPVLRQRLRVPGPLDADSRHKLQAFLDRHETLEGVEFDSLTKEELAANAAFIVPTHTKDPKRTDADGENLMVAQTVGLKNPEKFKTFMPWPRTRA